MDKSTRRDRYLVGVAGGAIAAAVLVLPLAIMVENRLPDDDGEGAPATAAPAEPTQPAEPAAPDLDPAMVAAGQEFFQASCAVCHGPDAAGIDGLGKPLVGSDFVNGLSDAELAELITVGRGPSDPGNTTGVAMPPKGGNPALSADDIGTLVAFIRSLN